MKNEIILGATLAFALASQHVNAQKLEAISVTPLIKTSQKAEKSVVSFNKDAKTLQMIYVLPETKKAILYDKYNFDWNLNLVNQTTEEVSKEQATAIIIKAESSTNIKSTYDPNKELRQVKTSYYKVIFGGGALNSKIQQGQFTATETWSELLGDYIWEVSKGKGQELKIKDDDRRISGEFAMGDQNSDFIKPGLWEWETDTGLPSTYLVPEKTLTIVGSLQPKIQKTKGTKIVDNQDYILKTYNIENGLKEVDEHLVKFTGPVQIVQKICYHDGSMGALFVPMDRVSQLGFDRSILYKPNQYTYMHFGIDGRTIDSIAFECPVNAWKPDYIEFKDDALYLAGPGSNVDPAKYYWQIAGKNDHFIVAKISQGKLDYIEATPVAKFSEKAIKPESQKKAFAYPCNDLANGEFIVGDKYIWLVGQYIYRGKNLDFLLLQFDLKGQLQAQYTIANDNPFPGELRLFNNPDNETVTWMITETSKFDEKTSRKFQYLRMATINPEKKTLSEVSDFGPKTKEQKMDLFLNPTTPMIILDKEVILIGGDEDNKNIWLAKIAFGSAN